MTAAAVSSDGNAACTKAPLGGDKAAFFPAMEKRMAAAHGIAMKKVLQKGSYAGSGFAIAWYRFGTPKEIEDATGITIGDDPAPGMVKHLMLLGDNSQASLDRMRTLVAASVNYFTRIDESQIAPEVEAMLKKAVAAEPTKEDVLKPGWKLSLAPVAEHLWGSVHVGMPAQPQIMNTVQVNIDGICK